MTSTEFDKVLARYLDAALRWMNGDPTPWAALCSQSDDLMTFEARGGSKKAWSVIGPSYSEKSAPNRGGTIIFDSVSRIVAPELAVAVDFVRGNIRISGEPNEMPFDLRVMAVFRKEGASWRLVHRHVDPMANPAA